MAKTTAATPSIPRHTSTAAELRCRAADYQRAAAKAHRVWAGCPTARMAEAFTVEARAYASEAAAAHLSTITGGA